MKPCTIPAELGYLWMAGLSGFILALAVVAVLREVERKRGRPG